MSTVNLCDPNLRRPRRMGGFALIATITLLFLLTLIGVALLSMATVQVRDFREGRYAEEARANARLALMMAISELQRELGPDQRISASAEILASNNENSVPHRYWTGVWSSQINGKSPWERDDSNGGLRDRRSKEGWNASRQVRSFLVSGNEGAGRQSNLRHRPEDDIKSQQVELVGRGSVGNQEDDFVRVPKVGVQRDVGLSGHYGYWIGDLGVRANVATRDPHTKNQGGSQLAQFYPFVSSPSAGTQLLNQGGNASGPEIEEEEKGRVISVASLDHLGKETASWRKENFHHLTVTSQGVLSDVREGGLKRNLTAFFNGDGSHDDLIAGGKVGSPGLTAADRLVGPANQAVAESQGIDWSLTRHRKTAPRFGLLRDWARLSDVVEINTAQVAARVPKSAENPNIPEIAGAGFQNLNPASLMPLDQSSLTPIIVEGSLYSTLSSHPNPPGSAFTYNIRSHNYPRIVLWNPYNVPLILEESIALIQVNGRRGFQTDSWVDVDGVSLPRRQVFGWLSFGGREREDNIDPENLVNSETYHDPYTGSRYYSLPETRFEPGDCLVFTAAQAEEYDGGSLENNLLSCEVAPDPQRNYYHSSSEYRGGMNWYPKRFWYSPSDNWFLLTGGQKVQGDDSQMILKSRAGESGITPERFDLLPQICAVSCSTQYGAGKEPIEAWDVNGSVEMERTPLDNPVLTLIPDRKTRQGYRLRWLSEHPSHFGILGNQVRDDFWQESFLGSWNLRSAYATRSPWENIAGNVGNGIASGPWFFGIYTRDLYDDAISWDKQRPFLGGDGRQHGNPFGRPELGEERYILFDLPRRDIGIVSLGQLQHAKVSDFVWHPSFPIGNSLVDPRLSEFTQDRTAPLFEYPSDGDTGGFSPEAIGWSDNQERSATQDEWARMGRALYQDLSQEESLVYDLSFEVNHNLWDAFFLSSGSPKQLNAFVSDPVQNPLPNARMNLRPGGEVGDLNDLHRAASKLILNGAFNVNSTSVEAWKALLSGNRRDDGMTPFPRHLQPPGGEWREGDETDGDEMWAGSRVLTDAEIQSLANEIVREVKERGPFLSLSDFVNRRLAPGEQGRRGPLEAAIRAAGLNASLSQGDFRINNEESLENYDHPDNIADATRFEQTLKPDSKVWGAPAYLTQGDVLQAVGSHLAARSDTFVVRAYGEAMEGGKVKARAWCEAVVQRTPDPVNPDETGLNPQQSEGQPDFGRRFIMKSFRWMHPDEV